MEKRKVTQDRSPCTTLDEITLLADAFRATYPTHLRARVFELAGVDHQTPAHQRVCRVIDAQRSDPNAIEERAALTQQLSDALAAIGLDWNVLDAVHEYRFRWGRHQSADEFHARTARAAALLDALRAEPQKEDLTGQRS